MRPDEEIRAPMWHEQDPPVFDPDSADHATLVAAARAEHKRANDAEAARDRALAEVALLREQLGVERLVSYMQQESLRTGNPEAAPRWDDDPIVIEHGWTEGRCRRCGEVLPPPESALAAARSRIADLEAENARLVTAARDACDAASLTHELHVEGVLDPVDVIAHIARECLDNRATVGRVEALCDKGDEIMTRFGLGSEMRWSVSAIRSVLAPDTARDETGGEG